ncbi:MAG TPA: sodium:solute symporter, partial [bacterium]|nr:sodium:solute symporter [bacterium]
HQGISDPERVLPIVISQILPVGIKGLLVAGLMAAAMSTFDSTVNAGAAYWVKDIYQAYLKPGATPRQLVVQSRISSILIVLIGLFFALFVKHINEIWGWITMSIGAGMLIPMLARWYWWRMNGYGFAWGIIAGMVAAIIQKLLFPGWPEYFSFSLAAGISLVGVILGTYLTKPTEKKYLEKFYKKTRPFGFWGPIRTILPAPVLAKVNAENRRDIIATFFAVPWQIVLFLTMMMIVMQRWDSFGWLVLVLITLSVGLYFTWFRHLSAKVDM